MQFQAKLRESFADFREESLGLLSMLDPTTKSSAKRTMTMSPCACVFLHC